LVLAVLVACSAVIAAEGGKGNGRAAAKKKSRGYRLPGSVLTSCPVISRLGLDAEQVARVRKLEGEVHRQIAEAGEQAAGDPRRKSAYYKKRGELLAGLRADVVGLLSRAQRRRYEAGQAIVEEYERKIGEAMKEYLQARRAAGGEQDKIAAARQVYDEKKRPLVTERDCRLDDEVGRRPQKKSRKGGGKSDQEP
jgi:hypothetical protein